MHPNAGPTSWVPERTLLAAVLLGAAVAAPAQSIHRHYETGVMGTELRIDAYGSDTEHTDKAILLAVAEMRRIEDLMTTWRPSPLTELNQAAGGDPRTVPAELAEIIGRARELHRVTSGAFDVTFYAVGQLWDFKAAAPSIPDADRIQAALPNVDASRIVMDPAQNSVALPDGMAIDLGGIAKGYGVDQAMAVLRKHGIQGAMVNAGGDLKALGTQDGEPWEIAIKHPRDRDRAIAVVRLSNQCLVTSGDYERFFEIDGKRYHHILDPRTGMPATGCMSATVVAHNAELADALATACCVLGPEKGLELIRQFSRAEAILVGMDGEVVNSPGLPVIAPQAQ